MNSPLLRTRARRASVGVAALAAAGGIGTLAAPSALATHYHCQTECHGLVYGSSTTDGVWHSRVEANGSSSNYRRCNAYHHGDFHTSYLLYVGGTEVSGSTGTCNFQKTGDAEWGLAEAHVYAYKNSTQVISNHAHYCDPIAGCQGW